MIIRSKRTDNFTVVNNAVINDGRLDWKDLGLLVYLLSKPDNWQVCPAHLMSQRKTGKDGIYAMLRNLRNAGFIEMQKQADGKTNWIVFDKPYAEKPDVAAKSPNPEKPDKPANSPYPEKPDPDNPPLIKTELITKTESSLSADEKNCFDWANREPFWTEKIKGDPVIFKKHYCNGKLKAQYEQAIINHTNSMNGAANHEAHPNTNPNQSRKLTPAERVAIACGYTVNG